VSEQPGDEHGTWTVTFTGGPGLAGTLAKAIRFMSRWRYSRETSAALDDLAAALDGATFWTRDADQQRSWRHHLTGE